MRKRTKIPHSIILVVAFYLVAAISAAFSQQNWEFLGFYIPFFFLFVGIVIFIYKRVGFPKGLLWGLALWGALHLAGGLIQIPEDWHYDGDQAVLYSWWLIPEWLKYDHAVHGFGFGVATWLCWESLRANIYHRFGRKLYPSLGPITLAILAGMGLGAVNEMIEFLAVLNLENTNVGGYYNTGWDLVANLVGCLFAGVVIFFRG
ncbi:MAG: hypothetical protein ACON5H_01240 [Akkermansiaceae bacterium]